MIKNKKILAIGVITALLAILILKPGDGFADVGNINDYGGGDGGGGGGGTSSWSSSDSSYSSDSGYSSSGGGSGSFGVGDFIILTIIITTVIILHLLKKSGKLPNSSSGTKFVVVPKTTSIKEDKTAIDRLIKLDPSFSVDQFLGWSREVFMKIQTAWTKRDWSVVRPFESNELYAQHKQQLQEYIDNHKINKIEKITINQAKLINFRQDGDKEVVEVYLSARFKDYVIDDRTNRVIESNKNTYWNMEYIMTFNRKTGVKTKPGSSNKSTTNCPNCAAPTDITSSGKCKYCDSVITTGEHDWVLSDIRSAKYQ